MEHTLPLDHKIISKVSDIPDSWTRVQDSQDISAVLDALYKEDPAHFNWLLCEVGCLFVEVLDGEYGCVYYAHGTIPYLNNNVYRIQ